MSLYNVIGYSYGGSAMTSTFNLPNPAGRVPAAVGRGTDANTSSFTVALGSTIGEYVHQLSIAEMPSHNHGVAGGGQIATNNSTSMVSTGITLNDPQHRHTGVTDAAGWSAATIQIHNLTTQTGAADDAGSHTHSFTTNLNSTGITLYDPTHSHVMNPAGGDRAHNNVQPTIGMGNMFIYSGKVNLGSFPYTTGTLLF